MPMEHSTASFGTAGKVATPIGLSEEARSVVIQPDGKIVASGLSYSGPSSYDIAVVRYNPNGSLDTTFGCAAGTGCTGKVVTNFGGNCQAEGLALQPVDGKIVVAGIFTSGTDKFAAAGFKNTNGTLDTTFGCAAGTGCTGKVTTAIGGTDDEAFSVAVQPSDGKIVLAGYSHGGSGNDYALVRYLTNGTLDPSFNGTGKVTTSFNGSDENIYSLAIQPGDGKIVAAGYATVGNLDFAVARYNSADGSLDTTFGCAAGSGCSGKVTTPIGTAADFSRALALQPDGKLVVAGSSNNGSNNDFAAVRYQANGTLDATFGTGGKVTTAVGSGNDGANAVAIQADGKIVAAGKSNNGTNDDFALVRYNGDYIAPTVQFSAATFSVAENGSSATITVLRFGESVSPFAVNYSTSNGSAAAASDYTATSGTLTFGPADVSKSFTIQILDDLLFENNETVNLTLSSPTAPVTLGTQSTAVLTIVDNDVPGLPDPGFGASGKVVTSMGSGNDQAYAEAIQPDGKIVLAGYSNSGATDDFVVARYNFNGTLDTSFGTGGKVVSGIGASDDDGYAIALQPDGKIVVGGASYTSGNNSTFGLIRYNTNGTLDTSFGSGGKVTSTLGGPHESVGTLGIQPDGKIVAGGSSDLGGGQYDFALVRYNPNGSLDATFNGTGKVTTPIGSSDDHIRDIVLQADGKIVVAGDTHNGSNYDFVIARYNGNGSLDTSFNTTGKVVTPIGGGDDAGISIAVQADGKFVVGGYSSNGTNLDFALVRYNTNGSLDTSFGTGGKYHADWQCE